MPSGNTSAVDLIHGATQGKPYVFVVMPFGSYWHLFEQIRLAVLDAARLGCIRADDVPGAGFDLLDKIHTAIERAELVIAEITERNANVFYELGYAVGIGKPILLTAQRGSDVPTDLRGRELILHADDKDGFRTFGEELRNNLQRRTHSQVSLLRDMLEAQKPLPSFIVASPKYPGKAVLIPDQPPDCRTFGDNLGILGLLSAFGSVFGETGGVELVSGQYYSPELSSRDHNLYVIGSPGANLIAADVMDMIQSGSKTLWRFRGPSRYEADWGDPVSLYWVDGSDETEMVGKKAKREFGEVCIEDYGVVMRGPHPANPGRLLTLMAGGHSLGTGAACIAATRSQLIREIRDRGIDISDRKLAFWALVRGVASKSDGLLDVDGVTIERVGTYSKRS